MWDADVDVMVRKGEALAPTHEEGRFPSDRLSLKPKYTKKVFRVDKLEAATCNMPLFLAIVPSRSFRIIIVQQLSADS